MSLDPPPSLQPIITDQEGFPALPWTIFFNGIFNGDAGDTWVPLIANLVSAGGTPQVIGRVFRLSQYISFFSLTITPAQGGSTSGTAGTTGITNFPLRMANNGICFAVSGLLGSVAGMCDQQSNVIYPPSWSLVTVPITILGIVEAS